METILIHRAQSTPSDHAFVNAIVRGDYTLILQDDFTRSIVAVSDNATPASITQDIQTAMAALEQDADTQLKLLCVGVAFLESFVQSQWTGPSLQLPSKDYARVTDALNKDLVQDLARDGELCYPLVRDVLYLKVALVLLMDTTYMHLTTAQWWTCRALFVLERVLENPVGSIYDACKTGYASLLEKEWPAALQTQLHVEVGVFYQWHQQDTIAVEHFKQAQKSSGLEWELSGALGKRTKFQQFDVSQLVLLASSASSVATDKQEAMPDNLLLQDDTLLESIAYTDAPSADSKLSTLDQCILLAFCLNVRNTNPADGLTVEQMLSFVSRVLQHPNNWSVHSMALLLRSRLESRKSRTVERSALQLQALVDQLDIEDKADASIRLRYFYALSLVPRHELERELADQFLALGATRSALDIFLRLEMWDSVIHTYTLLQENVKAEKLILQQLDQHPNSPKFLSLLGDIRKDPALWQQAWDVSNQRYGRAMRSLGNYHFTRSNFTECIDAFSLALKLNPLFENIWFIMGCAAMQIQNWPVAEHAFSRVVAITFDNAEAWNNLGSVYLRQHQKEPAFRAFQNALKEKHDDYRIWRNFFWTSLDIHRYAESMEAILTLVELQGASFLDEQDDASFHLLVHAILDLENGQLASKMLTVFTRVTEVVTHRERIWAAYTDLLLGLAKCEEAFQTSLKAYRAVSIRYPTIVDNSAFAAVAACGLNVAHVYGVIKGKDQATSSMFSQTKSLLRTLTGRTRRVFEDHEAFTELENALEELEE